MQKFYQVLISAEDTKQANVILDALLKKKLILGGPVIHGPAKFWWKSKIVKMDYSYILTYTSTNLKKQVITEAEKASAEEIPMISFIPFEGNGKLLELLKKSLKSK